MTLTQRRRYLKLTRNSFYISFPANRIVSCKKVTSSPLYVRLKYTCWLVGRALKHRWTNKITQMLIISELPKSISGRTKYPLGWHAARVFDTPAFIIDIQLLRLNMHCARSVTIRWSDKVFINDFTSTCRREKRQSCHGITVRPVHCLK